MSTAPADPAVSGSRLEAYDGAAWRTRSALALAGVLHVGFLLFAYLRPVPPPTRRSRPIIMDVMVKPAPPPTPKPPEPPPTPPVPPPTRTVQPTVTPPRALPRELQPVKRDTGPDPSSSAIVVPTQPPTSPNTTEPAVELPRSHINLFPKSLVGVIGGPGVTGAVPKGPDRLLKDERLEEKKAPDFELIPEKGGGFRSESKNFIAHIKPDGGITFDNRFPIGFNKGGTFSFDLTDLAMRGKKQDPYAAEKRRFLEFSDQVRTDLRNKALKAQRENALTTLGTQLHELWNSGRSAASRRRELYEKWEDCSDDKTEIVGRKGRHAIEDFIHTYLPAGSPDAFTDEELDKIAGSRQGLPPFDPYHNR